MQNVELHVGMVTMAVGPEGAEPSGNAYRHV